MNPKNLLFANKYRIPSARLATWDYRTSAPYFITICTRNREHYFGKIENGNLYLNDLGQYSNECLHNINKYSKCARVTNQIVMPNHVHIIIELNNVTGEHLPNRFGPLLQNSLSGVINHFKGRVTKYAKDNGLIFGWQARFHSNKF
jgi:REP element-mobilizing transposase RayT